MTAPIIDQEPKPVDIYLDIDHVWQLDPEHNIPENERRTICAVACMKMVIDYALPDLKDSLSLHTMVNEMRADGGQDTRNFWKHTAQVDYFKKLGLISWRRNWDAPSQDPKWFSDNEHYDLKQLVTVSDQISSEFSGGTLIPRITQSLVKVFEDDMPVIVSVKPGFSRNKQDHQVVLNGFLQEDGKNYFYYTDPVLPPEEHQAHQRVESKYFFDHFNYRAIFARKS